MREALRLLAHLGFAGPVALGLLACALLAAAALPVVASLARPQPGGGPVLRIVGWAVAACTALALALGFALITNARRREVALEHPLGGEEAPLWARAFDQAEATLLVTGAALGVIALLVAAAVVAWQARTGSGAPRSAAHFFAAVLVAVTCVASVRHAQTATSWPAHCGRNPAWCVRHMETKLAPLPAQGRLHVLAIAAAGALALAGAATWGALRGERRAPPRAALPVAALVLASGIAAHRATRDLAADAQRPPVLPEDDEIHCPVPADVAATLAPAGRCDVGWEDHLLVFGPGGAALDGVALTPEALRRDLADKRERFVQMLGSRSRLPPLWITVIAPAATPSAEVVPYLSAIFDEWGKDISVLGGRPTRAVTTRTLGTLVLAPRCCGSHIRLDAGGEPALGFATWGDLARAADAASAPLEVAVPFRDVDP